MAPDLTAPPRSARGKHLPWPAFRSVRHKLLAMALGPLLVLFPLLVVALVIWGNVAYDRLLITKVRSDLSVAQGYFDKVLDDVGQGMHSMAVSHALVSALSSAQPGLAPLHPAHAGQTADTTGARHLPPHKMLADMLERYRHRQGLDFMRLYTLEGWALDRPTDPAGTTLPLPPSMLARMRSPDARTRGELVILDAEHLHELAPELEGRTGIALVHTPNATPTDRTREDRAMMAASVIVVRNADDLPVALLVGGVLMNQNLGFIDHINRVVYPEGSLPFGSRGTATLFLDDVRITTNVRLFEAERAIGTRVSQAVRDAVLGQGDTWLDRAFVVNDWYVSAYQPLLDGDEQRIGMLYVGYLEQPFRWVRTPCWA